MNCGTTTKSNTQVMCIPEGEEREKRTKEIFETVTTENFSQINVRYQITVLGSLEGELKTKQNKKQKNPPKPKNLHFGISFSNYRKSKIDKKFLKEARGKVHLPC